MVERIRVFKGTTELEVSSPVIIRTDNQIVDSAKMMIVKSDLVDIGSVIDFKKKDGVTTFFSAKVIEKDREGLHSIALKTNGYELNNLHVIQVYENRSPEYIVEDLITNHTANLTYASTESSGITIAKYVAKGYLIDIIKEMMQITGWQLRIDESDNVYFEPKGNVNNGHALTNGDNFQMDKWIEDDTEMINQVRVVGNLVNVKADTEEFNGDGSTKTFTLTQKPVGDVFVSVGGVRKAPGVDGTGDYTVDHEQKKIIFGTAPGSGTNNVDVDYNYQIRVVVEDQDDASIATTGFQIFKEFQAPSIDSFADGRRLAAGLLDEFSTVKLKPKGFIPFLDFDRSVGEVVTVTDPQRNLSESVIIRKITYEGQTNKTKLIFERIEYNFEDLQEEIKERIKKLEKRTTDDEVTAFSRISKHNMRINMKLETFFEYNCPQDSFILGHQTLGRLRADLDYEADCSDQANHGTWQGSDIGGSQYATNGFRLSTGSFNGSDNYITITHDADLNSVSDFTIALSVRVESLPGTETYLLNKWDGTDGYAVRINSSNKVELIYSNGGSDKVFAASTALTAKTYQHIVFVKSSTSLTVYVNGVSDNTDTGGATVGTNSNAFEIGRYSTNYFTGKLDEVRFYNDNKSASDILNLFNKTDDVLTDCKLWMSMDNPRLGDRSGRRHTVSTSAFLETFRQTTFKGSPFTSDWDITTRRLRMSSNPKRSRAYQSIGTSIAYGCGGRSFATVTVTADEHKWGNDIIKYLISTDGSNWDEVGIGESFSIPAAQYDNFLYWKVIFIGNGGQNTYITNLRMAYTLA